MSQQLITASSDFQEQPDECRRGRVWRSRVQVPTVLGSFTVEITPAPDDELVSAANEAINLLAKEHPTLLNVVYGLYRLAAEDQQWMERVGVPCDLSRGEMADYVSDRCVSVRRDAGGRVRSSVSVRVRWDDEHLVWFAVRSGRLLREAP